MATTPVAVIDNKFDPKEVTIQPGDTVEWTADEDNLNNHTVTSKPLTLFDQALSPGDKFCFKFDNAGTVDYVCIPHEAFGMVAR